MTKYRIIYIPNGNFLYECNNYYKNETYEQFLVTTNPNSFSKKYINTYLLEGDYSFISSIYAMLGWKTSIIFNAFADGGFEPTVKNWFEIVEVQDSTNDY